MTATLPVLADQRQLIADAITAAGIPGVTAYPQAPATISPGDAWAVWEADEYTTPCLAASTYGVWVALPGGDLSTAVAAMGGLRHDVPAAIVEGIPTAAVTRAEPAQLAVDDGGVAVLALRFTTVIG